MFDLVKHFEILSRKYRLQPFILGLYWGYFRGINGFNEVKEGQRSYSL